MRYFPNELKFVLKYGNNGTNSGKIKQSNIEDGGKLKKSAKKFSALLEYAKNKKKSFLTTNFMTKVKKCRLNKKKIICLILIENL